MPKVTIDQVSKYTGLSRGTVSRALNDRPDISEKTKARVLQACRELSYVPSHAARSLALGRSFAVAIMVDNLIDPNASEFLRGACRVCQQATYEACVYELGDDPASVVDTISKLRADRLDGVLIGPGASDRAFESLTAQMPNRTIVSTRSLTKLACDVIGPDWELIVRACVDALRETDEATSIVTDSSTTATWMSQQIRRQHPSVEVVEVSGEQPFQSAWNQYTPRVVIGLSGPTTMSALAELAHRGLRVGQDVEVLSLGNTAHFQQTTPRIPALDVGWNESGRRGAELMVQRIERKREDEAQSIRVAPRWVGRDA